MVKIGKYEYEKSTKKDKKLMVTVKVDGKDKTIHFGGNPNTSKHFKDKTGLLDKKLNHGDNKIKKAWYARHSKIKRKDGTLAIKDPSSASYHSAKILWSA